MKKEYRLKKGWKIFISIFVLLFISILSWLVFKTITNETYSGAKQLTLSLLWVSLITLFIIGWIDAYLYKIVIHKDYISKTNILGTKSILFKDVKGIRKSDKYIHVISKEDTKSLNITTYIENSTQCKMFLQKKFVDLDVEEYIDEEEELYDNKDYGRTQTERVDNINKAQNLSRLLNYISFGSGAWFLFYPTPYNLLVIINTTLPIIGLLFVYRYNGLIRIFKVKNSPYPSLSLCLTIPFSALMIRTILDYDILDYSNVWLPSIVIGLLAFLLIIRNDNSEFKIDKKWERIIVYCYVMIGFGAFAFF